MGCPHRAQLEDFAAGRLKPNEAQTFQVHHAACADCSSELARVRAMRAALASYRPPDPTELEWARIDRKVLGALSQVSSAAPPRLLDLLPAFVLGSIAAGALLVFALRASAPGRHAPAPADASALAVALGPDSLVQAAGSAPALLESEPRVRPGSHLYSGAGSISLQTGPASGIYLAPESHGTVERLARGDTALRLVEGVLLAEVKSLAPGQRFEVCAGDLRVQVRGTAFAVERSSGLTSVSVVRGLVEVGRDGETTRLLQGPSSISVQDGAPLPEAGPLDAQIPARFPLAFADADVESVLNRGKLARLHSRPEGAEVWVGGAFRGITPLSVLLPPGRQPVRMRAPGRPDLDLDLEAGVRPVELAALPPVSAEHTAPQKGAGRAEHIVDDAPANSSLAAPLDGAQENVRSAMRLQVRAHMDELVRCYEWAMKRNPALAGTLTLNVSLDRAGSVRSVRAREAVDQRFLDCVADSIRGWELPGTGSDESVQIPIHLARKG